MLYFTKKYILRTSDFDVYDKLRPSAILDLFQDAAGEHASVIGVGYEDFIKRDMMWVLLRTRYELLKTPPLYSEVEVRTWPLPRGRGDFDRDYEIYSSRGELLVKGSSKWCVCNYKTRRILFGDEVRYNDDEYVGKKVYPEGIKKISDFPVESFSRYTSASAFCDLDHNGHVNNIRYADYICNAIAYEKDEDIISFGIDYVHELQRDSEFDVFYKKENGIYSVKCLGDGLEIFRAKIAVKDK